jgi:hypothetical protein
MAGTWQALVNQPPFNTSTMILLTDGRVMVQEEATPHWHALTPDKTGSYVNGTWSPLADMSIWRRYYASGTLRDGRVIVVGGEQSGGGGDTNRGEIYDPVADAWTPIALPPWPTVGDASCCLLPDGRLVIGGLTTPECIIYDPVTDTWWPAASKAIRSNEETWILLPDDTIITAQCWEPYRSERYSVSSNAWKDEGKPPVMLVDPGMHEIGPAMLTYDGKVIFFGAADVDGNGKTAIYTPPAIYTGTGTWAPGPDIPRVGNQAIVCNDCPAALMPNGKVLVAAAPYVPGFWGRPIYFFEFDPFLNTITQAPAPPNNASLLYWSRLILLPTGQVLFSPSTTDLQCYTPDGESQEAWRPTVGQVVPHCDAAGIDYYLLRGTQLNGLSQGNVYGDDCNPATNYPLVRLRSQQTGEAYYCRTYGFSTMAVATGPKVESVRFDASSVPYGDFELCVVANGISSHCVPFCHRQVRQPCASATTGGCCGTGDSAAGFSTDCCCEDTTMDPRVARLQAQVDSLQRSVQRIGTLTTPELPERQPKDSHQEQSAENQAAGTQRRGERPSRRRRSS